MIRRHVILWAVLAFLLGALLLLRKQRPPAPQPALVSQTPEAALPSPTKLPIPQRSTNRLGDLLTDAQEPEFRTRVFPKFQQFSAKLRELGVSPLSEEISIDSCNAIKITQIPGGLMCQFIIGESWTVDYARNGSFEGIMYFGQRGPDNPLRAISSGDTNALSRFSQQAMEFPEATARVLAKRVSQGFGIQASQYEAPELYEEGLFQYKLGMYTIRYRAKGSDPLNQLNYTREFTLKATSPGNAVLVSYSNLDVR